MRLVKRLLSIATCAVLIFLTACGSGSSGPDVSGIVGDWTVRGFFYNGRLVDVNDVEGAEDLYDGMRLSINEDGSFVYLNSVFGKKGMVKYLDESDKGTLLLDSEEAFMYGYENGEIVQNPTDDDNPQKYLAYVLDESTLEVCEYDAALGKPVADKDPYIFVLEGKESAYLDANKFVINSGSGSSTSSSNDSTIAQQSSGSGNSTSTSESNSYQGILDEYTEKMENAVPGLVREYNSEASGVSDINKLAEICNDKIGALAEICNEGVSEMAKLMQKNGDSYDTYEKWANKLMNNYTDISNEIMDVYLDSAM